MIHCCPKNAREAHVIEAVHVEFQKRASPFVFTAMTDDLAAQKSIKVAINFIIAVTSKQVDDVTPSWSLEANEKNNK